MAKKFGKFLMFTALAGAAVAGAYYYLQNKNSSLSEDLDDDDFDDFSDDLDDDTEEDDSARNYVALDLEKAGEAAADTAESKVEEFFDDDDDNSADSI